MPCNDISEVIRLRLDHQGRLIDYSLRKNTCGAEIGSTSLLLSLFKGLAPEQVLALDSSMLWQRMQMSEKNEYLYVKHWVALQEALSVYVGRSPGSVSDACRLAEVVCENEAVELTALIAIDALTEKIRACGNCGSCGKTTPRRDPS